MNNLDTLVDNYLRRLLEIPASVTLSIVILAKSQFGLDILDISTKFKQCQVVMRQCLKNSCNQVINHVVHVSSDKSKQYDIFKSTKTVLLLLWCLNLPENEILFLTKQMINTCIGSSY